MEQAEDLVDDTRRELEQKMRLYTVSHLDSVNVDQHANEIKETEQILKNFNHAIGKLVKKFSSQLGQERVNALNAEIPLFEEKFMVYRESFKPKLTELRGAHSMNTIAVSSVIPSMNNLALSDSFQVEQNAAKKKVQAKLEAIMEDLDKLSAKACQIDDWSAVTDLAVERAMRENDKLRKEFDRINGVRRDVKELSLIHI